MKDSADLQGTDMDYVRSLSRETLENTTLLSLRYVRTAYAFEQRVTMTVKEAMDELDRHVPAELRERADRLMAVVEAAQIERWQLLAELVVALGPAIEKAMGIEPGTARFEFGSVCDPDFSFTPDDLPNLPTALVEAFACIGLRFMRELPANITVFIKHLEPIAQPIASRSAGGDAIHANAQDLIALLSRFVNHGLYGPLDRSRRELSQAQRGSLS
ncbi:MAG: hypothetical protein Q8S29_12575 [Phreatobacter sp.]|nr:hypothetical protein [Phreatobacter sp.]